MRSLLIAAALCAVATLTGCSFTISGPCTSLSHQSRLNGDCGSCVESDCGSCQTGMGSCQTGMTSCCDEPMECPTTNFGQGLPNGFGKGGLLGRLMAKPGCGDCGGVGVCGCETAEAPCDTGCAPAPSMDMSATEVPCDDGCESGGLLNRARPHLLARAKSHVASIGCGRMGCGRGGQLCNTCRGSLLGPRRGPVPRVEAPQGPGAGVAPSYVYPYYTTRGPRDFLLDNPPSIGY